MATPVRSTRRSLSRAADAPTGAAATEVEEPPLVFDTPTRATDKEPERPAYLERALAEAHAALAAEKEVNTELAEQLAAAKEFGALDRATADGYAAEATKLLSLLDEERYGIQAPIADAGIFRSLDNKFEYLQDSFKQAEERRWDQVA